MNAEQNEHIELLSGIALRGGHVGWNSTPISDSELPSGSLNSYTVPNATEESGVFPRGAYAEREGFRIPRPMLEALGPAAISAAIKRDNTLLAEPYVEARRYKKVGPATATRAVEEKISDVLDAMYQKLQRKIVERDGEEEEEERADRMQTRRKHVDKGERESIAGAQNIRDERARHGTARERVRGASDRRSIAVDAVMPLDNELLAGWNGWLHGKINAYGPAHAPFMGLHGFLQRRSGAKLIGGKKFGELDHREKSIVRSFVEHIVEAGAR